MPWLDHGIHSLICRIWESASKYSEFSLRRAVWRGCGVDAMVEPWHDEDGGADVLFSGLVLIPHAADFGFLEQVMVPGKSVPVFLKPSFLRHAMA